MKIIRRILPLIILSIVLDMHAQAPPITSGLILRLDAAVASSFHNNGVNPSVWDDLSGKGNHLTSILTGQSLTAAVNPVWNSGTYPYVQFNNKSIMSRDSFALNGTVGTMFYISSDIDKTTNYAMLAVGDYGTSPNPGWTFNEYCIVNGNATTHSIPSNWLWRVAQCSVTNPQLKTIHTAVWNNGGTNNSSIDHYLNGVKSAVNVTVTGSPTGLSPSIKRSVFLGSRIYNGFWQPMKGRVYEVLIYDRALTPAEINTMSTFLKTKYAINYSTCGTLNALVESLDSNLCLGENLNLQNLSTASAGATYTWDFGLNAAPATFNGKFPPVVSYSSVGNYTVKLKIVDGLETDSTEYRVHVGTVMADAGRDTALCSDTLIYQLGTTASANCTYLWTPSVGLSNAAISNPILNTNTSRMYILKVTDTLFNCVKYDTVIIALNFNKKLYFNIADTTVCYGDAAQFTYSDIIVGSPVFNWNFGPAANPPSHIGLTPPQILFTDTGFFNVQLKRQSTCGSDSITRQIYIVPKVQVNAGRDTTLCADSLVYTLGASANPNYAYQWNPVTDLSNPTIANPILNTKNSNQYIITSTNQIYGCFTRDTVNISISNKGNFKMNILDSTLCITAPGQFSCTGNLLPGVILNWTFGLGASIASFAGTNPPLVTFSDTGIHWIKLVKSDFCSTDSVTRSVRVAPIPRAYAGSDTNLCTEMLIRNLGEQPIPGYSYSWTPIAGLSNSTVSNPVLNTSKSATYVLTVLNSEFECSNSDAVQFVVNPHPRLRIEGDSILCAGQSRVLKAISNYPVRWNSGNIGDTILVNSKSLNKVKTASGFCPDIEDSIFINQYDKPFLFFDSVIIAKKEESKNIELNTNGLNIKWNPLMDLLCTDCKSQVVKVKSNTTYFITASIGECSITKPLEIKLKEDICDKIGIPTGFSPNGDGVNDLFRIKYPCRFNYFEIQIYNRWGELVFESRDPDFNWDGAFKGAPQPLGLFVYNLSFSFFGSSINNRNGNLTLIR